ncbi:GmrSD restriction endonuclease domain-containing protein [Demequina aurantiaca]|uniref:GmrSD restriction endonuclease domain-containing protein n=1 Tax=Demequina aurantiaca TaxID=676200 RepID=UPI003D344A3C
MKSTDVEILAVNSVFEDVRYEVPIYQRAYAWGEDEILTLLRDVKDRHLGATPDTNLPYYLGTLVTYARQNPDTGETTLEVVDGQQRLTTLFVILALTGQVGMQLSYEGRDESARDLQKILKYGRDIDSSSLEDPRVSGAVQIMQRALSDAGNDGLHFTADDASYLGKHVRLLRTTLPGNTDLNHYFEVMNSRGEQLEKHEIVRAHLIGLLTPSATTTNLRPCCEANEAGTSTAIPAQTDGVSTFDRVWSACADLSRHVQLGFTTGEREELFGSRWDKTPPSAFSAIDECLTPTGSRAPEIRSLSALLSIVATPHQSGFAQNEEDAERYGAIIDFPNFLLHALALSVLNDNGSSKGMPNAHWSEDTPFPLDDKQLVSFFKMYVQCRCAAERFTSSLLRARFLFDAYVIKTDQIRESEDNSNWVLQVARRLPGNGNKLTMRSTFGSGGIAKVVDRSPRDGDDEETEGQDPTLREQIRVVMAQSMFQVTDSRRAYKVFLHHMLRFLTAQDGPVSGAEYGDFLEELARQRYLATKASPRGIDRGQSTTHFVFNYLDYVLWKKHGWFGETAGPRYVKSFRFKYRKSVEHFFPQNVGEGTGLSTPENVNTFGNLCLMTNSENSKRSNLAPSNKIGEYRSADESLKFQLMAQQTIERARSHAMPQEQGPWNDPEILEHEYRMLQLLDSVTADHG